MAQLGELYEAIDNVKKLGLDVTGLLKQVEEKENQVLSSEIIPSIKEVAGMLLQHFRRDVDITIHHKNGQPLSIDFSHPQMIEKEKLCEMIERPQNPPMPVASSNGTLSSNPQKHYFHVKMRKGVHGIGLYDEKRKIFKLLKGSILNPEFSKSITISKKHIDFLKNYCDFVDGLYVLRCDYDFSSPSTASKYVLGRSSNGWDDWHDNMGKSLGAVYRSF